VGHWTGGGRGARGAAAAALWVLLGGLGCGGEGGDSEPGQYREAYQLRFIVQPSDARAGEVMQPTVEVEVVDASGARMRGLETLVHLQLPSRTQGDNLHGFSIFTKDGRGSFPYLTVMHPGAYELEAHSFGLVTARSRPFTITDALSTVPAHGAKDAEAQQAR
jgi:hypothetical protein